MDQLLNALKAIAEPTRLRILILCLKGELTVSELVWILNQSQPRISRHLKLLVEAGLLERIREGTWVFHRAALTGVGAELTERLSTLIPMDDRLIQRDMERLQDVKRERSQAAAAYFSEIAMQWDEIRSLHVDDADIEQAISDALDWNCISTMIDIGTGTGHLLERFGPLISQGEGIDLSREMLAIARANLEAAALPHCQVRQGDLFNLPNDPESFDLAVIHQVLHFVDDPALAIIEAARVLKPGGRLVIVDFAPHDVESLRQKDNHRRLGFADSEAQSWFAHAGLIDMTITKLTGDPLTVCVWVAEKPETASQRHTPPQTPKTQILTTNGISQ